MGRGAMTVVGWALGLTWMLLAATRAQAQVEANHATQQQLQTVRGIGPVLAERIVQARAQRAFTDWQDFEQRVPGVGPKTAQSLSLHGLRIAGRSFGAELAHGATPPAPPAAARAAPLAAARPAPPAVAAPPAPRAGRAPPPDAYPPIPGLSTVPSR